MQGLPKMNEDPAYLRISYDSYRNQVNKEETKLDEKDKRSYNLAASAVMNEDKKKWFLENKDNNLDKHSGVIKF